MQDGNTTNDSWFFLAIQDALSLPIPESRVPSLYLDSYMQDGKITDDTRIRASVPTLKYLSEAGARVVVSSHLGRPKSGPEDKFRLTPVAGK
jgi:hypothetical protein